MKLFKVDLEHLMQYGGLLGKKKSEEFIEREYTHVYDEDYFIYDVRIEDGLVQVLDFSDVEFFTKTFIKDNPQDRKIVASACIIDLEDGTQCTLIGARHWDSAMHEVADLLIKNGVNFSHNIYQQGFIDQFGDYHGRENARAIADRMGQVFREVSSPEELYSENLY